ncbi:MAG TPA: hypothetical protein VHA55_14710 [Pseudorhodoplanes sp.]|jgi:hypothetical protein|nr:hypothetical protein [Pseudorhodoplanes sp.]
MRQTLGELAPRAKGFQVAMISGQVVIVEPASRRVVEVIRDAKN